MKMFRTVVAATFAVLAGLVETHAEVTLDDLAAAVQAIPKNYPLKPAPGTYGIYDLRIENLCGSASSISDLATGWVDAAPGLPFFKNTRSVALTMTIQFSDGKIPTVKVPLVAVSNGTTRGVKLCDPLLVTDVPRGVRLQLSFEFSTTDQTRFQDPKPVLDALNDLANAASKIGGITVIGPVTSITISVLKDLSPVGDLVAAANRLMALGDKQRGPRPTVIAVETTTTRVAYLAGKTEVFGIAKNWRPSRMNAAPDAGYGINVTDAYTKAFSGKNLYTTFGTVVGATGDWTTKPSVFCDAMHNTIGAETGGDRVAIYVALAEHANWQTEAYGQFPDNFKAQRKTCLYPAEVKVLTDLKWPEPFTGAFAPARSPAPATPVAAAPAGNNPGAALLTAIQRLSSPISISR